MIKRTLYFSNPYYLSTRDQQLVIMPKNGNESAEKTTPIEDLGFVILDHPQITISYPAIQRLTSSNVALVYCDEKHLPTSMMLPLQSHHVQNERFRQQVQSSKPLKKQLWKQTISAKLENQATLLDKLGKNGKPLHRWKNEVQSGDITNKEAQGSRYYWANIFKPYINKFTRDRYGAPPNQILNYGYAVLRAAVARSLVGAGLLPTLGIHHHNKYNAFCLADDIMEPYRPFVDETVFEIVRMGDLHFSTITREQRAKLLSVLTVDTIHNNSTSPLMVALNRTAASLAKCFNGEQKQIAYPKLPI